MPKLIPEYIELSQNNLYSVVYNTIYEYRYIYIYIYILNINLMNIYDVNLYQSI